MGAITRSYIAIAIWRVVLLYLLLAMLRVVFYLYNIDIINSISCDEIFQLLRGTIGFDSASIVYINGLWLLLTFLPLRIRAHKLYQESLFWLYMVVNTAIITVGNLADTVYFHYTQKRFTSDELIFAENGNNSKLAFTFLIENWYLVIVAAALTYLLSKLYLRGRECVDAPQKGWLFYPIQLVVLLCCVFLSISGIRGGISHAIRPQTLSNATLYTTDNAKAFMILSNPFCVVRTLGNEKIELTKYFDEERLAELYSPYHYPSEESVAAARHKGYNVFVFIMESFSAENSAFLSPDLYEEGDPGYMPFLDSLMREGVVMREMYANGGRSICATPAVVGSLPSLEVPFILLPQSLGESAQMPAILSDLGYSTYFFCGSEHTSMGFSAYTHAAGVENYYAREEYEQRHGYNDFDGMWGIYDMQFVDFAGEVVSEAREPFFAGQFTISSHHPFTTPPGYEDKLPEGVTKIQPLTTYTDLAFRNFFAKYSSAKWFNNTIFVFVSDHVSSEKMAERTKVYPGNHHIVGAIYTPDGSLKGEITDVAQQSDIMPTILGLIGYDKPYFAFGRDIFNEGDRPKWSVSFDGGTVAYGGGSRVINISDSDTLKAYEQQYFEHILKSSYLAPIK